MMSNRKLIFAYGYTGVLLLNSTRREDLSQWIGRHAEFIKLRVFKTD